MVYTARLPRVLCTLILLSLLISLVSGCGEPEKQGLDLSQQVAHTNYQFNVPAKWEVVYSEIGDPTVYFKDEDQEDIGGLVLLRLENAKDLGESAKDIPSLATDNYKVYKGTQNDERFICFHIPSQNSGYQLYFKSKTVSEDDALSIARTFKLK